MMHLVTSKTKQNPKLVRNEQVALLVARRHINIAERFTKSSAMHNDMLYLLVAPNLLNTHM